MSTTNKVLMNVGHAPRGAINSAPVRSLVIGATSDAFHESRKAKAIESVVATLVDQGFDKKTALAIAVEGA